MAALHKSFLARTDEERELVLAEQHLDYMRARPIRTKADKDMLDSALVRVRQAVARLKP